MPSSWVIEPKGLMPALAHLSIVVRVLLWESLPSNPSDCGNRSLTGHADGAVCNEWQVLFMYQHMIQSQTTEVLMSHRHWKFIVLSK